MTRVHHVLLDAPPEKPLERESGGSEGARAPPDWGHECHIPRDPSKAPQYPRVGHRAWGVSISRRVPIVPEGSPSPRGVPLPPQGPRCPQVPPLQLPSAGSSFLEWVPTAWGGPLFWGQVPSVPRTPQGLLQGLGPRSPPGVPTHLAALAGAHPVVVPGAAVAAHEARLVHAGGGRWRGGARVPQNPPRGGLQGWGEKGGGVKQPLSAPLQRGPIHEAQVECDFGGLAVTSMALKPELQIPKIGVGEWGGWNPGVPPWGGHISVPLLPPGPPNPQNLWWGCPQLPQTPKFWRRRVPSPPKSAPRSARGDTAGREGPPRAQPGRRWGRGSWFHIFFGWVLCVLLKKNQNC